MSGKRKLVAVHQISDGADTIEPGEEFTSSDHEKLVSNGAAKYWQKLAEIAESEDASDESDDSDDDSDDSDDDEDASDDSDDESGNAA
ncbi:MAG: hypothetical protein Hals2KO_21590 [Halioglobus sp.]